MKCNYEKTTHIFIRSSGAFENNVGGCESLFWGVCRYEELEQKTPCVFCPHHIDDIKFLKTLDIFNNINMIKNALNWEYLNNMPLNEGVIKQIVWLAESNQI